MNRKVQRGLVAAVAALAMFPTAAVAHDDDDDDALWRSDPRPYVTDQYTPPPQLWTPDRDRSWPDDDYIRGRVVTRYHSLNVRSGPSTRYWIIGSVHRGSKVYIKCKKNGSNVHGNRRWYKLADRRGWVPARYVYNFGYVPWC
jgi:uncharacterized protein YgiM (DUF1202 family)